MSNLSSRVMNMKFMQKDGTEAKEQEVVKKVQDSSEWALPSSSRILSKSKQRNVVENVGYTSINAYNTQSSPTVDSATPTGVSARRTWGAAPAPSEGDLEGEDELQILKLKDSIDRKKTKKSTPSDDAPKEFLRNLWDKQQPQLNAEQGDEVQDQPKEVEAPSKKRKGDYIPNIKVKQKRLP